MARQLRIEYEGGLYHVTSRGDRQEDIYIDDDDKRSWLDLFGETCKRFRWLCRSYCLMTNHYHIVIETPEPNLSKGMRHLNGVYTQRFNYRHKRVGHVFQGRYKGIIVDKNTHLLELGRYVVLNPVRAGMVEYPDQYHWSSYRDIIGKRKPPPWLIADVVLSQFDGDRSRAISQYVSFVREGMGRPSIWENLKSQVYLGDEEFIKKLQEKLDREILSEEIPKAQRTLPPLPLARYKEMYPEKEAMARAWNSGQYSQKAIGDFFQVHYGTVSRAVKKFEDWDR